MVFLCVTSPCHRPWVSLSPPCPLPWPWGCFSVNSLETRKTEGESKEIFKSLEGRVLPLIFTELLLCGSASCAPAGRWMRSSSFWLWRDVADSPTQSSLTKLFLKGFRNNELRGKYAGQAGSGRVGNGCNRNLNVGYEIKKSERGFRSVLPSRLSPSQVCQWGGARLQLCCSKDLLSPPEWHF